MKTGFLLIATLAIVAAALAGWDDAQMLLRLVPYVWLIWLALVVISFIWHFIRHLIAYTISFPSSEALEEQPHYKNTDIDDLHAYERATSEQYYHARGPRQEYSSLDRQGERLTQGRAYSRSRGSFSPRAQPSWADRAGRSLAKSVAGTISSKLTGSAKRSPVFLTQKDIEQSSSEGRSHFHVPPKMIYGEAARVTYVVALPGQFLSATEKRVRMTPTMKATLSGRGFLISAVSGSSERGVSLETPTVWEWDVAPTETGTLVLEVRLTGYVDVAGREMPTEFESDKRSVVVRVKMWGWVRRHPARVVGGVLGGIGVVAAVLAVPGVMEGIKSWSGTNAKLISPSLPAPTEAVPQPTR